MNGCVIWFTGLPASGKSTAARRLLTMLRERGCVACLLDGDDVRDALVPPPGHSAAQRDDFYATLARLAALLAAQGLVVLVSATAHRRAYRDEARRRAGGRFYEVLVDVAADTCAERDPKGLYAASRAGRITNLPGVGVPYEPPLGPDATLSGGHDVEPLNHLAELVTGPEQDRR